MNIPLSTLRPAERELRQARFRSLSVAAVLMLAAVLYAGIFRIWAYGDELGYLARGVDPATRWQVLRVGLVMLRPVDRLAIALNVVLLGLENTALIHLLALTGFLLSLWLIYRIALLIAPAAWPGSWHAALLASLLLAVLPANVLSLTPIDTLSQQYASVFVLLLIHTELCRRETGAARAAVVAGAWAFLALLAKESGLGALFVTPLALYMLGQDGNGRAQVRRADVLRMYVALVGASLLYLAVRYAAGAPLTAGSGTYALSFDLVRSAGNAAQLLGSLVYWGSSLDLFPRINAGRVLVSALISAGMLALAGLGLRRLTMHRLEGASSSAPSGPGWQTMAALLLWILAGTFPVILLGRVSELYTYASAPFYALLMGLLIGEGLTIAWAARPAGRSSGRLATLFLALAFAWLAAGTVEKVQRMNQVSEVARRQYSALAHWAQQLPPGMGAVICWNRTLARAERGSYSKFVMSDRDLLRGVSALVGTLQGRRLRYMGKPGSALDRCDYQAYMDDGGLHVLRGAPPE